MADVTPDRNAGNEGVPGEERTTSRETTPRAAASGRDTATGRDVSGGRGTTAGPDTVTGGETAAGRAAAGRDAAAARGGAGSTPTPEAGAGLDTVSGAGSAGRDPLVGKENVFDGGSTQGRETAAGGRTPAVTGERTATGERTPASELLPHEECDKLAAQLRHAVAGFVDGPRDAVEEADHVLEELALRVTEAVTQRRRTLRRSWQGDDEGKSSAATDTEQLRLALRDYRELADRLLHV